MSAVQQQEWISEAEFWEFVSHTEGRHEYFNGHIYAMAGGGYKHARLIGRLSYFLEGGLANKPCTMMGSEFYLKVEATGLMTLPDNMVHCEEPRFEGQPARALLNPVAIFEVLSPSTESYDRGEKFAHYRRIPSLRDYVLISPERVGIEHYSRESDSQNKWVLQTLDRLEDTLVLPSIDWQVALADLYQGLDIPVQLMLLRPDEQI